METMKKMGAVIDLQHNLLVIGDFVYDYGDKDATVPQVRVADDTTVPARSVVNVKLFVDGYNNGRLTVQDQIPFRMIGFPTEEAFIWVNDGVAYARIESKNDTDYELQRDAMIMSVVEDFEEIDICL